MKDLQLKNIENLISMVLNEGDKQVRKWGVQDRSPFEWLTFATEELGELACAISEYEYRNGLQSEVVKEAIQTATLCLKIAEMYLALPTTELRPDRPAFKGE